MTRAFTGRRACLTMSLTIFLWFSVAKETDLPALPKNNMHEEIEFEIMEGFDCYSLPII